MDRGEAKRFAINRLPRRHHVTSGRTTV